MHSRQQKLYLELVGSKKQQCNRNFLRTLKTGVNLLRAIDPVIGILQHRVMKMFAKATAY